MLLVFATASALALPCGLHERLHEAWSIEPVGPSDRVMLDLGVRNPFDVEGAPYLTDHFALWQGPDARADDDALEALGIELEKGWDVFVGELAYPPPAGTDTYHLNVYVGNSGGGAPGIDGPAGYATLDSGGYPYLVVEPSIAASAADDPRYPGRVVVHEFMHTIQLSLSPFQHDQGLWFYESHAEWSVPRVYGPGNEDFLGAYFALPHYALFHHADTSDGGLAAYRQYGAQVFVQYLDEHGADAELIRQTWLQGTRTSWPTAIVDRLLAERGSSLDEAFADFVVRNVTFDYAAGDVYHTASDVWSGYPGAHALAEDLDEEGTDWAWGPEEVQPRSLAYNLIRLEDPQGKRLLVGFDGKPDGSRVTEARWFVALVREKPDAAPEVVVVGEPDDPDQELELDDVVDGEDFTLVVAQLAVSQTEFETFRYRYQLLAPDADPSPPPAYASTQGTEQRATVCAAAPAGPWVPGWLLIALVAWRRRGRGSAADHPNCRARPTWPQEPRPSTDLAGWPVQRGSLAREARYCRG